MAYLSTQVRDSPGNFCPQMMSLLPCVFFTWPHFHQPLSILQHLVAMLFTPHSRGQSCWSPTHRASTCVVQLPHFSLGFHTDNITHYHLQRTFNLTMCQSTNFSLRMHLTLHIKLLDSTEFDLGKYVHQPSICFAILPDASAMF